MSPRAQARPRGGGSAELAWWLIPAAALLVAAASTATFVGGRLASVLTGHGMSGPRWRLFGAADLGRVRRVWPGVPAGLVWTCSLLLLFVALALLTMVVVLVVRGARRPRAAARSMAAPRDVAGLDTKRAAAAAVRMRPSLAEVRPRQVQRRDRGVTLGRLLPAGRLLQASWEDVIVAVMAPRTGKTTSLAVPVIVDAPGAVLACSNKADLYLATASIREAAGGRVWVFDPQHITHTAQRWWWNPLGRPMAMDDATRLAGGFIMGVADDDSREIWGPAATELLGNLIFAAHLGGRTLMDVYRWLFDEATDEPVELLRARGHEGAANSLAGTQGLAAETRASVYFTARAGTSSLRDNDIARWVSPQAGMPMFDPDAFVESDRDTLYLLSKNVAGGTSAAALVAALTTEVRVAAERASERRGGRMDPPLMLVLDEVANICRIRDLPEQYSHMGSRAIVCIAILQSYAQGERVWGKAGMKELWGAATIKLIGPGADDADFAEDISRVVGEHDIDTVSYNRGRDGGSSSTSTRRERILPAAEVRAMPKGHAVLLATGMRPAMIRLLPWFDGPRKAEIAAATKAAGEQLRARVEQQQRVSR